MEKKKAALNHTDNLKTVSNKITNHNFVQVVYVILNILLPVILHILLMCNGSQVRRRVFFSFLDLQDSISYYGSRLRVGSECPLVASVMSEATSNI